MVDDIGRRGNVTRNSSWKKAPDRRIAGALGTVIALTALATGIRGIRPTLARPALQAPVVSWTEPRVAWEINGHTSSPTLVADAWGKVHLFFLSQADGDDQNTLYHADADNTDAVPIDVLIGMSEYRVTADPYGRLHVVAQGDTNTILYTAVDATEASDAGAWSSTARLGFATLGVDISADTAGGLHLCYPTDHAVVYQHSEDGGLSWSDPSSVSDASDPTGIATHVRCVGDGSGAIHVAWSEATPPNFYPPEGVYYSRSPDGGESWTAREQMAGQHYSLPSLLADPRGRVHLLWQGDVSVGGRFYRQRTTEGDWGPTETVVPDGQGGLSGDAFMAVDSRDTLHVGMTIDGIYWATRRPAWSAPHELSGSLRDLPNTLGSIEQAALAIANGNEIYVAFEFDFKRIYLMTGQSNAPPAAQTPRSMATATMDPALAATAPAFPSIAAASTSPTAALGAEALEAADENRQPSWPMLLAAALASMVVGVAIWLRKRSVLR